MTPDDVRLRIAQVDSTYCGWIPQGGVRYDLSRWADGGKVEFRPLSRADRQAVSARVLADIQRWCNRDVTTRTEGL